MRSYDPAALIAAQCLQDELRLRALKALPGGITRTTVFMPPHPPYLAKGIGARVIDVEGRETIDANNNYTSLIHGHAHPAIVAAATEAIKEGASFGLPTIWEIELAERLKARVGLDHWRFCNSGTEAVMMAMRCARAYTGRDVIIRFRGSYHGTSDGVVDDSFPGIPVSQKDCVIALPQGDLGAFEEVIRRNQSRVAGVLLDLMPNRAGLVPADPNFVARVRELTLQHSALLIGDEVISFRVAYGGMFNRYKLKPNIVVVGKIIGGGFPVGAIGASADVLRAFHPLESRQVAWGGTFSANPVTMRSGCVALDLFDEAAVTKLNSAGQKLREALTAAGVAVTGAGSLLRLPIHGSDWWSLYDQGLLVCGTGMMSLSTAMSLSDLDAIARIITRTLTKRASQ